MDRLKDKIAIITGATSGIGKAAAVLFAKEGAKVIIAGFEKEDGENAEKEIKALGGEATFIETDLLNLSDIDNLVNRTIEMYGRIDILFGNAGAVTFYNFHEIDMEKDYQRTMDLHVKANFYITKLVLPYMMEQKQGSCLYTLSVAAAIGQKNAASYSTSKGALKNFIWTLAMEYGKYNIRFNGILPGLTFGNMAPREGEIMKKLTPRIPLGRGAEPEEIANAALFFACDESSFCTGSMLQVDGGETAGYYAE